VAGAPAARFSYGVIANARRRKTSSVGGRASFFFIHWREGRPGDVDHQQSDPLGPAPLRFSGILFSDCDSERTLELGRSLMMMLLLLPPAAQLRGSSPTRGIENQPCRVAIGVIRSTQELAETEWAKEWGAIVQVNDRGGGSVRMPGPPWRFSRSTLPSPGSPAYQGEHNAELLTERGISQVVIEGLRQRRVLLS
jgi:hypothetical protein